MSASLGIIVFARFDSKRLPGKALRPVGGIPLLERVIRRAQLLPWPVYLATTTNDSDNALVELADGLGVASFRGSTERVLDRAVHAADEFGLDAFGRLCADRPLFPLDTLDWAMRFAAGERDPDCFPDLVTNRLTSSPVRGLTTEVVRSAALRRISQREVSAEHQEHLTAYMYAHQEEFVIVSLPQGMHAYARAGFAVDTESDLLELNEIFAVSDEIDMSVADADQIHRS